MDLLSLGMDFAGAYGGARWDNLFGGPAGVATMGGPAAATAGSVAPGAAAPAAAASGAAAPVAAATGTATAPKGLLSGVLDSKWLQNPLVGYTALGIGQGLMAPDPADAYKAQYKYGQKAEEERRRRIAENYKRVPPPSDRRVGA